MKNQDFQVICIRLFFIKIAPKWDNIRISYYQSGRDFPILSVLREIISVPKEKLVQKFLVKVYSGKSQQKIFLTPSMRILSILMRLKKNFAQLQGQKISLMDSWWESRKSSSQKKKFKFEFTRFFINFCLEKFLIYRNSSITLSARAAKPLKNGRKNVANGRNAAFFCGIERSTLNFGLKQSFSLNLSIISSSWALMTS